MQVVGLCGFGQSGKDTAFEHGLKQLGYTRIAFADALKKEISDEFDITLSEIDSNKKFFRGLLVYWGELRRRQDPQYWIKKVSKQMTEADGKYCITDVRYVNECDFIESVFGFCIRIVRPYNHAANAAEMESITAIIDKYNPVILRNDGSEEDLGFTLVNALREHKNINNDRKGNL